MISMISTMSRNETGNGISATFTRAAAARRQMGAGSVHAQGKLVGPTNPGHDQLVQHMSTLKLGGNVHRVRTTGHAVVEL